MKLISIGTDRKLFEEGSTVRGRLVEYGAQIDEIHVIVFSLKKHKLSNIKISPDIFIYPTNSISRLLYISDAIKIGRQIIENWQETPTLQSGSRPKASALKIENLNNTVITTQDPFECGYVGLQLSKQFDIPLHIQVHTDFLSKYFKVTPLDKIRVRIAKYVLPKADRVRVVSSRIAHSIEEAKIKLKNLPTILPIRIDIEAILNAPEIDLKSVYPNFKFTILMASRLTKEKNIGEAFHVFQRILRRYKFAGLLIAGSGPEKDKLQKLAHKLGVAKNIVFLGDRTDVASLMKSVNIFLSTSKYEGYGMSVIEAGLCHLPVVSTNVGVADGLLKDGINSMICPVSDRDCLYLGIVKLMENLSLRELFSHKLETDIINSIPTKEKYIREYVKDLESAI